MPRKKKLPDMPYEFFSKVAGVTFKNDDGSDRQRLIVAHCKPGLALILRREPKNPYSENAIGVWVEVRHLLTANAFVQIGYITSRAADELAPVMDAGGKVAAKITNLTGSRQHESVGVNIEVSVDPPKMVSVDTR